MASDNAYIVLSSLISLLGVCYLLFWRYRKYSVDKFRQDLFALRDELFDYAAEDSISFSHPAYVILRRTMNGFIRFGHRLSLWQVLFIMMVTSKEEYKQAVEFENGFSAAIESLEEGVREKIRGFRDQMDMISLRHIATSAPELLLLLLPVLVAVVLWAAWRVGVRRIRRTMRAVLREKFRGLDDTALLLGE